MTLCVAEVCMAYLSLGTAGISPSLHDKCVIDGHADNDFCSSLGQFVVVADVPFQVCLRASTRQVSQAYQATSACQRNKIQEPCDILE